MFRALCFRGYGRRGAANCRDRSKRTCLYRLPCSDVQTSILTIWDIYPIYLLHILCMHCILYTQTGKKRLTHLATSGISDASLSSSFPVCAISHLLGGDQRQRFPFFSWALINARGFTFSPASAIMLLAGVHVKHSGLTREHLQTNNARWLYAVWRCFLRFQWCHFRGAFFGTLTGFWASLRG